LSVVTAKKTEATEQLELLRHWLPSFFHQSGIVIMSKRLPFRSRDPNVRPVDLDSLGSSIPSIEEALRNKGKKKTKTKTSFSSSKTPRISNRSRPSIHDIGSNAATLGSKHLRKLKQSMVNRQQRAVSPGNVSSIATKHTDVTATSVKRKGHSDDDVAAKKRLKVSHVHVEHSGVEEVVKERMSAEGAAQGEMKVAASVPYVPAMSKRKREVEAVTTKRQRQNVAAGYLHNHRVSTKMMARPELLTAHEESALHQPARSQDPVRPQEHFTDHTIEETMMDCSSDEVSLNLSPSPNSSPSREKVEDDKAWVLMPPIQPHARIPVVETEEIESSYESGRRHSITKLFDDSQRTPRLDKNAIQKPQRAKSDSHRGPIVTKDMLARARQAKPDNKAAVDAMLNSGSPYKGTHKRTFSPQISVVGKMIYTVEGSESLCESEVTLLTPESLDLQRRPHKSTKLETTSDDKSRRHEAKLNDMIRRRDVTSEGTSSRHLDGKLEETSTRWDAKSDTRMRHDTKSEDTSRRRDEKLEDAREGSQSGSANELDRRSFIEHNTTARAKAPVPLKKCFPFSRRERVSSIRQPEPGGVDEAYQVASYTLNNVRLSVMIPHPPLPSGWVIRISESKQLLAYSHPDYGTSWHCPVIMSQHFTKMITQFLSQFFGYTTEALSTDPGTETESSETCSTPRPISDQQDYASESGSQMSLTSASSAGHSQITVQSVAKSEIVDAEGESGSEHSLLTEPQVLEAKFGSSPGISTCTGRSYDDTQDVASQESLGATGSSGAELSPSSTGVAKYGMTEEEEVVTQERPSPMEVEEFVSTVRFRRSVGGRVIASNATDNGERELIRIKGAHGDDLVSENDEYPPVEPTSEDVLAQDDEVDVHVHNAPAAMSAGDEKLETEVGSANSRLNSRDNGMPSTLKPDNVSGSIESDPMEVDQSDQGMYDEDASHHTKDEGFETEIDNVVFGYDHEDIDLSPQVKHPSPTEDRTTDGGDEIRHEAVADILVSEHGVPNEAKEGDDSAYNEGEVGESRHQGSETKIDSLSEVDNLSPIQHGASFDNGSESLFSTKDCTETESDVESVFDKPHDDSPSRKGTINHGTLDRNNQQDDSLSIASSLTGMTTREDSRVSKWRGFSQRVLHPPCPLCSLVRIEELIKAAIARMKQRKAKASRKSFRKEKRDTATRLVFASNVGTE
jgi:hypothetical protein